MEEKEQGSAGNPNPEGKWTVTFTKRWGPKSWLVTHTLPEGLYANDRQAHVEIGSADTITPGVPYTLSHPHILNRKAIVYDVDGVKNGKKQAHFTVYYGPDAQKRLTNYPGS